MEKVLVEVIDGNVDGKSVGATLEISERSANYFNKIGYVKILPKPKPAKKAAAPKKTAKAPVKTKDGTKDKKTSPKGSKDK